MSIDAIEARGGLTPKRCAIAFNRALPALRSCVREAQTIEVRAKIEADGRLRQLRIGDAQKAQCIEDALSTVRTPKPDTGEANIVFEIQIRS